MMADNSARGGRIELAHSPAFALGRLTVQPALREVIGPDGTREVIQPRVMQVLVALARAGGAVVSRDDLTQSCWDGRVVGEDAINRVISHLRRMADGVGAGRLRIETVTKVGYRLVCDAETDASDAGEPPAVNAIPTDPAASRLMEHAFVLMGQDTPDAAAQAVGLLRRAVELAGGNVDAWGALALAYAAAARLGASTAIEALQLRAHAAAQRARAIDPYNVFAITSAAALLPRRGNWLRIEGSYRAALAVHPDNHTLLAGLAALLCEVGRTDEAAALIDRAAARGDPAPALLFTRVNVLAAAGRLEEADTASMQAYQLYPSHAGIWFSHVYLLLFTGRAEQALAFAAAEIRPHGIPERDFDLVGLAARAMATRAVDDIDRAVSANLAAAHGGSGFAENAIQFCAALGRLDEAFAVAAATYFGRGFDVPEHRFSPQQGVYELLANRQTWFLFALATRAMRADPRFEPLVSEIGLASYWADSGVGPDYRG